jgi:hypothetical protein
MFFPIRPEVSEPRGLCRHSDIVIPRIRLSIRIAVLINYLRRVRAHRFWHERCLYSFTHVAKPRPDNKDRLAYLNGASAELNPRE